MRLNPWLDERNHEREMTLVGHHFADGDNTQNTTICLFAPDAPGLKADSFPSEESVYFGTRAGRRRAFLPGMADMPTSEARKLVEEWRAAETKGAPCDPALIDRMVWEYQNVTDGEGMAMVMNELAARYPAKPGTEAGEPGLPSFVNLTQALNIAAADSRAVLAVVTSGGESDSPPAGFNRLLFEDGIAGRFHVSRLTPEEWAAAKTGGMISGDTPDFGVFLVAPDPYGLSGDVWHEVDIKVDLAATRTALVAALQDFRARWRKLDRKSHIAAGIAAGITWTEYDPDYKEVRPIKEGSKKLGRGLAKNNH